MENNILGKIILGAVLMIFGVVMISIVADMEYAKTSKTGVTSETINVAPARIGTGINVSYVFTLANAPTGWKITDCPITNYNFYNQSGIAAANLMTETTHYILTASTGKFTYVNGSGPAVNNSGATNTTYVTYDYCADDYLNSSWGRSVLNMIGGFIALMLIAAAVGIFYSIYKDVKE